MLSGQDWVFWVQISSRELCFFFKFFVCFFLLLLTHVYSAYICWKYGPSYRLDLKVATAFLALPPRFLVLCIAVNSAFLFTIPNNCYTPVISQMFTWDKLISWKKTWYIAKHLLDIFIGGNLQLCPTDFRKAKYDVLFLFSSTRWEKVRTNSVLTWRVCTWT